MNIAAPQARANPAVLNIALTSHEDVNQSNIMKTDALVRVFPASMSLASISGNAPIVVAPNCHDPALGPAVKGRRGQSFVAPQPGKSWLGGANRIAVAAQAEGRLRRAVAAEMGGG